MLWARITLTGLMFMGLGLELAKHGEPREGEYNFVGKLIATALWGFLLYKGGFYG